MKPRLTWELARAQAWAMELRYYGRPPRHTERVMSYKTILVHIDAGDRWRARLGIATRLVQRFEAHLVGLHALSSIRISGLTLPEAGPILTEVQGMVEARALETRAEYEVVSPAR